MQPLFFLNPPIQNSRMHFYRVMAIIWCGIFYTMVPCFSQHIVLPQDSLLRINKLPSGLAIYTYHNEHPAEKTEISLIFKAGILHESIDGQATMLSRIYFESLKDSLRILLDKPNLEFEQFANVGFEQTSYSVDLKAFDEESFEKALKVFASIFDPKFIVGKPITPVDQEVQSSYEVGQLNKYWPALFHSSPFENKNPLLFTYNSEVNTDHLVAFAQRYYMSQNAAIIITGKLKEFNIDKMIEKWIPNETPDNIVSHEQWTFEPSQNDIRVFRGIDTTTHLIQTDIIYRLPPTYELGTGNTHDLFMPSIIQALLNNRFALRSKNMESPFVQANINLSNSPTSSVSFHILKLSSKSEHQAKAIIHALAEIQRPLQNGFTDEEVNQTAEIMKENAQQLAMNDRIHTSFITGQLTNHFVNGTPVLQNGIVAQEIKKYASNLNAYAVNTYYQKLFTGYDNSIFVYEPKDTSTTLLDNQSIIASFQHGVNLHPLADFVNTDTISRLINHLPEKGEILSEQNLEDGTYKFMLANGAVVYYKHLPSSSQTNIIGYRVGGLNAVDQKSRNLLNLSASLINEFSVGPYTSDEIKKITQPDIVSARSYVANYHEGFTASTTSLQQEQLFQLVHLLFNPSNADQLVFEETLNAHQSQRLKLMGYARNNWQNREIEQLNKIYGIMDSEPPTKGKINVEEAISVYKERHGSATDFNFIISGPMPVSTFKNYISAYLASLPGGEIKKGNLTWTKPEKGIYLLTPNDAQYQNATLLYSMPVEDALKASIQADVLENYAKMAFDSLETGGGRIEILVNTAHLPVPHISCKIRLLRIIPDQMDKTLDQIQKMLGKLMSAQNTTALDMAKQKVTSDYLQQKNSGFYHTSQMLFAIQNRVDIQFSNQRDELLRNLTVKDIAELGSILFQDKNKLLLREK